MVIGTPTVLNLIPGGVMKIIHVNQVNENIEIQFRIMNGAQPFNVPEGVSCTIRGTKGDNFGYAAAVAVTAGSNIVTVTLTEQLTAVAGAGNIFELVFVGASDDMKVSTENFLLDVERAALGEDTVISDSDLAYADQVLDQLQSVGAVNAQVQQNKANIAAEITRATTAEQTLQQNINAEAAARQAADNTLQSNINAEASSRATTDASLQSQIDQLIAPSGSAPSAAEVENARIGSDGTVYPTLGDAIRTQNSLLKSDLNTVEKNISDPTFLNGIFRSDFYSGKKITGYNSTTHVIALGDEGSTCVAIYPVSSGIIKIPYDASIPNQYLFMMHGSDLAIPNANYTTTSILTSTGFANYGSVDTTNGVTTINVDLAKAYYASRATPYTVTHIGVTLLQTNAYINDSANKYPVDNLKWIDMTGYTNPEKYEYLRKSTIDLEKINYLDYDDIIQSKRIAGYDGTALTLIPVDDVNCCYSIFPVTTGVIQFPYDSSISGQVVLIMQSATQVIPSANYTAETLKTSTGFAYYGSVDTTNNIVTIDVDAMKTYYAERPTPYTATHVTIVFKKTNVYITNNTKYPAQNVKWLDMSAYDAMKTPFDVVAPLNIYGITNFPFTIYTDQILKGSDHRSVELIKDRGGYGKYYGDICYRNNAFLGNTASPMTIKALCSHSDAEINFNFNRLSSNDLINGKTLKVLFIGDSLTYHRYYIIYLQQIFTAFGGTLESVGTLSRTVNGQTVLCEGRAGWSAYDYCNNASFNEFTNAFMFNGVFDFPTYISTNNISCDIVCICLGTNDVLQHDLDDMIPSYQTMISSIRQYDADIPIVLWLPPTRAIGDVYSAQKDIALSANKAIIEAYDGTTTGVYIAPVYFAVNPYEDYTFSETAIDYFGDIKFKVPTDYIHPSNTGYKHVAEGFAHTLLWMCGTYGQLAT